MSRSFNEHHKMLRNEKCPSPYKDNEGTQLKHRRKMLPYGSQGYHGWGGEIYIRKWGNIVLDVVKKHKARKEAKKQILKELENEI